MADLDNLNYLSKIDSQNILKNINEFPLQIADCWELWKNIALPTHYINAKSVVILGIGGSGIGAQIMANLGESLSKIPTYTISDYKLPNWVDRNTLVIAVSYSGNTEETLATFTQAAKVSEKLITISTGGSLQALGSRFNAAHFQINYGSQPRAALGYSLTALLAIYNKLGFIEVKDAEIKDAISDLKEYMRKINAEANTSTNEAKILAQKLQGKIPIVVGSGVLAPIARRWKGQFNENSKTNSYYEIIPEMNHNALVGLELPSNSAQKLFFVLLQSRFDHPRNLLRQQITGQILNKKRYEYESIMIHPSGNILAEIFQMIALGDFVSYYLAIANGVAPEPVEIISFLKEKLSEAPFGE